MEISINKNITNVVIVITINLIILSAILFAILQFIYPLYKSIIIECSISIFIHLVLIVFSNKILLKLNYVSKLPLEHERRIKPILQSISSNLEIPIPTIYYINDKNINSISIGRSIKKSSICLTKGCFEKLNDSELEYLLTYEMIKILKRDTSLATISTVTFGYLIILSDKFFRSIFRAVQKRGRESESFMKLLLTTLFVFFTPINVKIIHLFVNKNLELINDKEAIKITEKSISAANTLQKCIETNDLNIIYSRACANMFFVNPLIKQKTSKKFSYHIDLNKRIENIKKI